MINRKFALAALAASISVSASAQIHVHSANCNHQFVENQGVLDVASGLAALARSQSNNAPLSTGATFILNDLGGVGAGTQARAGFERAAALWSRVLKDPITIRLDVQFAALGPNILGSTGSTTNTVNYAIVRSALAADAKSYFDNRAVGSLQNGPLTFVSNEPLTAGAIDSRLRFLDNNNTTDNNNLSVNTAQMKALGLTPVYAPANTTQRDGSVSFSTLFNWDFDPSDGIDAGTIDFVGVAAHEIGHALGFRSGVDLADVNALPGVALPGRRGLNLTTWGTLNDLQRYGTFDGSPTLDWSIGGTSCFSINAGKSCLAPLSTGRLNGDLRQASHWKDDALTGNLPLGIMDPTASGPNGTRPMMRLTTLDLIAFDTMGYDVGVPEPASWAMLIIGFGMTGAAMRRRRQRVVTA
ncbi:MAG: hypothetical protein RIS17_1599 [Pseudomonadota bacterium]